MDRLIRADPDFKRELEDIVRNRIIIGKDPAFRRRGTRRITMAIRRHNLWRIIKEDIINADLK